MYSQKHSIVEKARQALDHREEDGVERTPGVHLLEQMVHVGKRQLGREAGIDGAANSTATVELVRGRR